MIHSTTKIHLQINGQPREVEVDIRDTLLDLLRDRLGLTGAKRGCDQGECGACTVLLDDEPINACLLLAVDAAGRSVLTIEGLARDQLHPIEGLARDQLHPIQQAFVDSGAVQCGFCTPGMILSAKAFLDRAVESSDPPTRDQVRQALSGNLCRCTGYQKIVDAVSAAYELLRQKEATHV